MSSHPISNGNITVGLLRRDIGDGNGTVHCHQTRQAMHDLIHTGSGVIWVCCGACRQRQSRKSRQEQHCHPCCIEATLFESITSSLPQCAWAVHLVNEATSCGLVWVGDPQRVCLGCPVTCITLPQGLYTAGTNAGTVHGSMNFCPWLDTCPRAIRRSCCDRSARAGVDGLR